MTNLLNAPATTELSFLFHLKRTTRAEHESAEKQVNLFSRVLDLASYRSLLEIFWGFFRPTEDALKAHHELEIVIPDLKDRWRTALLEKDFAALGLAPRAIEYLPICGNVPSLKSTAQALGCLYVLEGATLGGQMIAKHVRECVTVMPPPCNFFLSYGNNVGSMWKHFGMAIENYAAENPHESEVICASARHVFRSLENWIALRDAVRP